MWECCEAGNVCPEPVASGRIGVACGYTGGGGVLLLYSGQGVQCCWCIVQSKCKGQGAVHRVHCLMYCKDRRRNRGQVCFGQRSRACEKADICLVVCLFICMYVCLF